MTSVYIHGDVRTPPRRRQGRVRRENEARTRVCESAITDGANVRTMDRFDGRARDCAVRALEMRVVCVCVCVCVFVRRRRIYFEYIFGLARAAIDVPITDRSSILASLCVLAKLSHY